jgi:hypothetical protein
MTRPFEPIDLKGLKTYSMAHRQSKVSTDDFATPHRKGDTLRGFLGSLPGILAADHIHTVAERIAAAARQDKVVLMGMGAHVIKTGLNPIVIDLMRRRVLSAIAMNGAGIIHDLEVALAGQTSEDVAAALSDGSFGMVRETNELLSRAIRSAGRQQCGLGEAVGRLIVDEKLPHTDKSLLAAGVQLGLPATVHVALGTDILHMHPHFDPAAAGAASHRDFRLFASVVAAMQGGVYLNVGSAVILPEVFLKATTLIRNLGHRLTRFTTVNMDFIQHYRPMTNVVGRPTADGGTGINLVGHHEIMLPLIAAAVIEALE